MIEILAFYCFFAYWWMFSERKRLFRFMINNLDTAPHGTTVFHCKVFSWIFWVLAPFWFVYWIFNKK